ncbi:MAG: class I SAM-dependent methyltransferase [Phaeodactylibacter sp.]|nr:class I SAM-dependent methyltransferase [Phaeodactylibacter sp.]
MWRTTWNRIRWTVYSPIYDSIAKIFGPKRAISIGQLTTPKDGKVLIVGAGTGLDLPYLINFSDITATDLTPAMLAQLKQRAKKLKIPVQAQVMNGQQLEFPDVSFDAVILHLILAVMPDPYRCLAEVERVLKPGGEVVIFDKFLPEGQEASWGRKLLNVLTDLLATTINRKTSLLLAGRSFEILQDRPVGWGGLLRTLHLKKPEKE